MWLKKVLGMDLKEKVFVSTVVKRVILLKIGIVQLEVGSVVNVGNMVIMLAAAKGEETQSLENNVPPNDRGGKQQRRGKGGQANAVEGPFEHSSEDDTYAFTIEEQTCDLSTSAEPVISVSIGAVSRDMAD